MLNNYKNVEKQSATLQFGEGFINHCPGIDHRAYTSWRYDLVGFKLGFNTNGVLFKKGVFNQKGGSYED